VAQIAVGGPRPELDFGDEFGPDIADLPSLLGGQPFVERG
jgi:hypothetical protein